MYNFFLFYTQSYVPTKRSKKKKHFHIINIFDIVEYWKLFSFVQKKKEKKKK